MTASRTEAASGQRSDGPGTAWAGASLWRAKVEAVGAEAKVAAMAAATMGTTEAVSMGSATRTRAAKGVAGTEGP